VKAISPIIAIVILVILAMLLSNAIALWLTGLTGAFTGVEKLEVVNAYPMIQNRGWKVVVVVKNTGTKNAIINNIFINNRPYTSYLSVTADPDVASNPIMIRPGESKTITITITDYWFASGQTISIIIHTASGGQYPATVTLP